MKLKKIISFSRGRTLSGHTSSTMKKFFYSKHELLTPLWQAVLGLYCSATVHAARLWFTLLGNCSQLLSNSSRWSDHEFDCSALFAPARTSSRRRYTTDTRRSGTSCGGTTPDTYDRSHGLRPQGWPNPQDKALRGTALLGASRKTPEIYPKDTTRSVRIRIIL